MAFLLLCMLAPPTSAGLVAGGSGGGFVSLSNPDECDFGWSGQTSACVHLHNSSDYDGFTCDIYYKLEVRTKHPLPHPYDWEISDSQGFIVSDDTSGVGIFAKIELRNVSIDVGESVTGFAEIGTWITHETTESAEYKRTLTCTSTGIKG